MQKYAILNAPNDTVREIQDRTAPLAPGTFKPDLVFTLTVVGDTPFDPATQDREGPANLRGPVPAGEQRYYTLDTANNQVIATYTVRNRVTIYQDANGTSVTYDPNTQDESAPVTTTTATEVRTIHTVTDNLAKAKAWKINEIKAAAKAEVDKGLTSSALGTPHLYDTDKDRDQINIIGQAFNAQILNTDVEFTTTDLATGIKAKVFHTPAQMQQVFVEGAALVGSISTKARTLMGAVMTATTVAEVKAVTWVFP